MSTGYSDQDLTYRWEDFFSSTAYKMQILETAALWPDLRSVHVAYPDLDRFDPDMAILMLQQPDRVLGKGEEAIQRLVPPDREGAEIHLRIVQLPRDCRVEIRDLRSKHLGRLIAVEGLVRKATEVRPRLVKAVFECARCGEDTWVDQSGMQFKEPMECSNCNKTSSSTKFVLIPERSVYVDTQKVEIQESPEGLRGGAQPERLTGFLEDDIAGKISPGDRIVLNGVLRSAQKGNREKSTLFDINLDVMSAESEQHEYEEIQITEEDEAQIQEEARTPGIMQRIVASISPTIYGYDTVKESIALQLFGGAEKHLDDGTRIRGDIHILMVGDPGVAKCVTGDSLVHLDDGTTVRIDAIVDPVLEDGDHAPIDIGVLTMTEDGIVSGRAVTAWRLPAPKTMVRITTSGERTLVATPTHPLYVDDERVEMVPAGDIAIGSSIAVLGDGLEWEIVTSKDYLSPPEWVYDIEVEGTHNFIANGIVSHNSQLLRYMSDLAPRGIYASGKSSSAAGLCVHPSTMITVDGLKVPIGDVVESMMSSPETVEDGVERQRCDGHTVMSATTAASEAGLEAVWRLKTPPFLVEIETHDGGSITVTPETRLMTGDGWSRADDIVPGMTLLRGEALRTKGVVDVRKVDKGLPTHVYDLTVRGSHAFLANGYLVHNTAAAVKDDFGDGRWTLEAGALVLADKGVACIDELDKMTDQDRSSMHEAMESQRISVAKAGITATLQCRCSILGAANPKYGRFEQHENLAGQINLPPALMSRFDLIFAMTDKPDAEKDRNITNHIISAHRRGQVRGYQVRREELPDVDADLILTETENLKPVYDIDFLRKYVAYSKRINPVMNEEAANAIRDSYLRIRKMGEGEGSSVPITARQLEAFVRLSEASARARLSNLVELSDAERAVNIVEWYLRKIAGDSGALDIDNVMSDTNKSQRDQIHTIRGAISSGGPEGTHMEDIIRISMEDGVKEDRIRATLRKLKTNGEIYEPKPGVYKLTRGMME